MAGPAGQVQPAGEVIGHIALLKRPQQHHGQAFGRDIGLSDAALHQCRGSRRTAQFDTALDHQGALVQPGKSTVQVLQRLWCARRRSTSLNESEKTAGHLGQAGMDRSAEPAECAGGRTAQEPKAHHGTADERHRDRAPHQGQLPGPEGNELGDEVELEGIHAKCRAQGVEPADVHAGEDQHDEHHVRGDAVGREENRYGGGREGNGVSEGVRDRLVPHGRRGEDERPHQRGGRCHDQGRHRSAQSREDTQGQQDGASCVAGPQEADHARVGGGEDRPDTAAHPARGSETHHARDPAAARTQATTTSR
ncbi:hypothetical protein [Streptomyces sp. NPDC001635]